LGWLGTADQEKWEGEYVPGILVGKDLRTGDDLEGGNWPAAYRGAGLTD
jgi:hypothetical protein